MNNPTIDSLRTELRNTIPGGGMVHMRSDDDNDGHGLYLYAKHVTSTKADGIFNALPEEVLGEDLYVRLDEAVNEAFREGTLPTVPGYQPGDRIFDLTF